MNWGKWEVQPSANLWLNFQISQFLIYLFIRKRNEIKPEKNPNFEPIDKLGRKRGNLQKTRLVTL